MQIIKQVIYYFKKTISQFFYYRKEVEIIEYKIYKYKLINYVNSNYAENSKNKKSIIEYYFFFNKTLAICSSKKQKSISISIIKAQYIA